MQSDDQTYCSQIFLVVDKNKLSSLADGTILQMDSSFLVDDFIFLLTSDLKIYVLTRIQQLYLKFQTPDCPDSMDVDEIIQNSERLVHVSAMIDLSKNQSSLQQNCSYTQSQQIFTQFGVDQNTVSLVVLCYNSQFQLMQEFEFQNPFTYNWIRTFPFFNYKVDSDAPHFTDQSIIYIYTSYQQRIGTMKAYLLFSIYDYTPNSAVFQVITCYPTSDPDYYYENSCSNKQNDKNKKQKIPYTYSLYQDLYGKSFNPSFMGIPFTQQYKRTITLGMFFFNNKIIINYLNYQPIIYANANLGSNVVVSHNLNLIASKSNLRDIHFNEYFIQFDLSDSEIQMNNTNTDITLQNTQVIIFIIFLKIAQLNFIFQYNSLNILSIIQNTKINQNIIFSQFQNNQSESAVYTFDYKFPINKISGPIESYQMYMYKKDSISTINNYVTNYNTFYGDFILLQKYYYSYQDTYFKYGIVQDILSFSSYNFAQIASEDPENQCEDCFNLIAVISNKYFFLIERESYETETKINPVTKIIYQIDLPTLDFQNYSKFKNMKQQIEPKNQGQCRMTLNGSSQILVYCVSNEKSTTFKIYQVSYNKFNSGNTSVKSLAISSTGGYIGYVDQIIPFGFNGTTYQAIKTHYILNQQMSCQDSNSGNCSLIVTQTFSSNIFQLSDTYIVDYDIQLTTDIQTQSEQIIGVFLSSSTINIFFFDDIQGTFDINYSIIINQTQIYHVTQTEYEFDLIFIKLLNVLSKNSLTFLLGTTLDLYEISYNQSQMSLIYTFGKYYQCEHSPGVKPVIFNPYGVPFQRKNNFQVNFDDQFTKDNNLNDPNPNQNYTVQSLLTSCSRTPSSQRPVFDPEPSIFSKEISNMFYIQYFIKNQNKKSWQVRILTYPFSSLIQSYVFEGFTNSANESRIIVSNFSYFLVENKVQFNLNLNLSLSLDQADLLVVELMNGFNSKQMNFTLNYDNLNQKNKNQVWFIILIVVISVVAFIAILFIVLWIRKQRNIKNEKKKEGMISSGLSDLSDHKSDNITNDHHRPHNQYANSKLFATVRENQQNQNPYLENRQIDTTQLAESKKSDRLNSRLNVQVDNLLRSVSQLREKRQIESNTETVNNQIDLS